MAVKFVDKLPTYDIPSKWDIIPVHASDRATFKFCRRQWAWSSPSRLNLVPRADVQGIRENLWFGTGVHHALQQYYTPLREDPVVAWETWFNLQCHGGLISEAELHNFKERNPTPAGNGNYIIQGLDEVVPFYDEEKMDALLDLGRGMMRYYKEYAEENDNFTVVATEHDFSVPILDSNGNALYMVDKRIMPNDYELIDDIPENVFGPLWKWQVPPDQGYDHDYEPALYKQCHARGRMDMILQDHDSGRYGIKDYKTAATIGDDYFRHLDLDEQCTTYLTLGEVEAIIYDLPYKKLEFILYEALLKGYPKPPTILKSGTPSLDRSKETTTPKLFEEAIQKNGLQVIFDVDPKMQSYYQWLLENESTRFINQVPKWRNSMQRINARIRLYYESIDMLGDPVCYPNPTKNYSCLNCIFRTPCLQAEDGSDYKETLEQGFEPNFDR